MGTGSNASAIDASRRSKRGVVAVALVVFAVFLLTSVVRAPVPAVNEPHYLGKAKHFWNPAWCAGDFFLESANAHVVFYATVGWLTQWLTLPQTAWVGRGLALLLLSWGWTRLSLRLFDSLWSTVTAATLFVLVTSFGSFSGEWVIGGVEGKVFTYGAALWSAACLLEGRWKSAAVLAGIAVSFHPVVGLWCVIAAAGGAILCRLARRCCRSSVEKTDNESSSITLGEALIALVLFVLVSLPGVLPALQIVIGVDPDIAREADRLQLSQRIGHHIDPRLFPFSAFRFYAALLAIWLLLWRSTLRSRAWVRVNGFVVTALLIAFAGLVIGWSAVWLAPLGDEAVAWANRLRQGTLKFYLFRLADISVPAIIALLAARTIELAPCCRPWGRCVLPPVILTAALLLPAPDANASAMSPADREHWLTLCRWIEANTPEGTLLATANEDWAVKWHTNRPEYVSFKDCPQDSRGIIEWWNRRQTLVRWSREVKTDGDISPADLRLLHERTGIDYLISSTYSGFTMPPIHQTGPFKVYRVAPDNADAGRNP